MPPEVPWSEVASAGPNCALQPALAAAALARPVLQSLSFVSCMRTMSAADLWAICFMPVFQQLGLEVSSSHRPASRGGRQPISVACGFAIAAANSPVGLSACQRVDLPLVLQPFGPRFLLVGLPAAAGVGRLGSAIASLRRRTAAAGGVSLM